ncbi:hypothetical protein pEaSNUABM39_00039 [Erwinia phage pEa_SNUABM_39]|nr:hypothetical protein pEaSNUABM39_00039 [Erwinia phage pEa_SNUABM_39]
MPTPLILLKQQTRDLLVKMFGQNRPFIVVRRDVIIEEGKRFGDRVYFSNGTNTVTVPNIQGLDLGDKLYIAEDGDVYEWHPHFERPYEAVSNNQSEALAFGLHPIVFHTDSRNS